MLEIIIPLWLYLKKVIIGLYVIDQAGDGGPDQGQEVTRPRWVPQGD